MSVLHFIILIALTILDAIIDAKLIKQRKNVHTIAQYVIREGAFILLAGLFSFGSNQYALYSWILSHIIYWWTFDTALNVIRFKPLYYLSERGIDRLQPKTWGWWSFKAFCAVVASLYFFNPLLYEIR